MFDEVFAKWIDAGQLSIEDIVIVLMEYDKVFMEGKITEEQIVNMIQHDPRVQICDFVGGICQALTLLGIHYNKQWIEVTEGNNIIRRFWNEHIEREIPTDSPRRDEAEEG